MDDSNAAKSAPAAAPPFLSQVDAKAFFELATAIAEDRWVLFIGSGVSRPSGVPTGQELVGVFNQKLTASFKPEDLPKATQRFEDKYSRADLVRVLMSEIDGLGLQPNATHDLLFKLHPRKIVTTNVEQILEKALRRANLAFSVHIWNQNSARTGGIRLLKPHGDVDDAASLVFTQADYDAYPQDAKKSFIRTSIAADYAYETFLFIGYSAEDPNFRALFQNTTQVRDAQGAGHYLITVSADELNRKADSLASKEKDALFDHFRRDRFHGFSGHPPRLNGRDGRGRERRAFKRESSGGRRAGLAWSMQNMERWYLPDVV